MADRALQILAPRYKSWIDAGTVNTGGKIYFYEAGTTTLKDTYSDAEATSTNANPVVLDTRGEAAIYGRGAYKIVEKTSADVQIGDAMDGVLFLDVTDDILALLNDATTATMRTTLGLGSAATLTAGTDAGNVLLLAATDTLPAMSGANLTNIAAGQGPIPYGYLSGFTLSVGASSTTLTIQPGACRDSTDITNMKLSTAYTKTLGSWAVGTGNGSLDTGSVTTAKWYYVFTIYNATTAVTDILTSLSPTAPTLPSGYATFRRIGAILTDGTPYITEFSQFGDEFLWDNPPIDIDTAVLGATAALEVLTVPTLIQTWAIVQATVFHASAATVYLSCPSVDDEAPAGDTTSPIGTLVAPVASKRYAGGVMRILTSAAGAIRTRSSAASTSLDLTTLGWVDIRGK